MSNIIINDVELELDLLDADVVEKYETLNREIAEKVKEPTQYDGLSTADGMRLQCRYIDEFFDKLFGKGTANKLFGNSNNLGVRMDAFGKVGQASGESRKAVDEITQKYTSARILNREQRRAQNKNKGRYKNRSRNR